VGSKVAVVHRAGLQYYGEHPYGPPNPVYEAVEAVFRALGMDAHRSGSPEHNPLGDLIAPGDRVVIKPNFVSSKNLHQRIEGMKLAASSTHASLLRPIIDYALRAAGPRGRVDVVDTPVEGCELEKVTGPLGVDGLIRELSRHHSNLAFTDLRYFRVAPRMVVDDVRRFGRSFNLGVLVRTRLPGDPRGYRVVDVGDASFFNGRGVPDSQLCFHRSHRHTPRPHHDGSRHEYSIPQTVLDADVIINVPKMKTHKKTGVTLSLKSFIGLSNEKYWLPHFTGGDPSVGGDEYDRPQTLSELVENRLSRFPLPGDHSLIARAARLGGPPKVIDGSWEGNDTLWRTILDLNRAILFADRNGVVQPTPQRRYFTLVDGIVAGEGEGPLGATPLAAGLLIGGFDPVLVDHVTASCMGYDSALIPQISRAVEANLLPTTDLATLEEVYDGLYSGSQFTPPRSWPSLRAAPHSAATA
jgi:uncharacterized protein (DUF362 family)